MTKIFKIVKEKYFKLGFVIFIFILASLVLAFEKKSDVKDDGNSQLASSSNKAGLLTGTQALMMFNSMSFNLENAKTYKDHEIAKTNMINFSNIANLYDAETSKLICQSLYQKTPEKLVSYDFFIRETLINNPCKDALLNNIMSYLTKSKSPIIEIDEEGNISINAANRTTSGMLNKLEVSSEDNNVFYGHEFPKNHVVITLDDGPHNVYTRAIVYILEAYGAQGTFFFIGNKINARSKDVINIVAEYGNHIGSHSFNHQDLSRLPLDEGIDNINIGHSLVKDILVDVTGTFQNIFRFPYGKTTPELQQEVIDANMTTFFWNVDSRDWDIEDPEEIKDGVINSLKNKKRGSIILLHDVHIQTVFAMPLILEELLEMDVTLIKLTG